MTDENRLTEDYLVKSDHYADAMEHTVMPWLKERQTDTRVPGEGGWELFCSFFAADSPRGTAVVVHGFTENAFKFSELIFSLVHAGFNVCAYDQRGHGRSRRDEKIDDMSLTHVDDFGKYVRDLEIVCDTVLKDSPKPWVLFSHSMGGAVAGLFLERHPGVFSRAVFCAPMIAPRRGGVPLCVITGVCRAAKWLGKGKKRAFVSRPYAGPEDFATSAASGKERFDWYDAVKAANPEFQNNGPTYDWALESMLVTKKLLAPGQVEKIDAAARVYAAEQDGSVLAEPQQAFAKRLKNGSISTVAGAKHEIYRSPDSVLFPWWHGVLTFLEGGEEA